jgi:hypothetical protein
MKNNFYVKSGYIHNIHRYLWTGLYVAPFFLPLVNGVTSCKLFHKKDKWHNWSKLYYSWIKLTLITMYKSSFLYKCVHNYNAKCLWCYTIFMVTPLTVTPQKTGKYFQDKRKIISPRLYFICISCEEYLMHLRLRYSLTSWWENTFKTW